MALRSHQVVQEILAMTETMDMTEAAWIQEEAAAEVVQTEKKNSRTST